jgi:hypothetical protein
LGVFGASEGAAGAACVLLSCAQAATAPTAKPTASEKTRKLALESALMVHLNRGCRRCNSV